MERIEVSPDSSTHLPEKGKKMKKRKHKHKSKMKHKRIKSSSSEGENSAQRKRKKEKRSSKSSSKDDNSDECMFDIRPLSEYVNDRKELHNQIFNIVPRKEVKSLLPELLKRMEYKELKMMCHEQLDVMSQKRLRHIIAGEEMLSSSSDESGLGQQTNQGRKTKKVGAISESVKDVHVKEQDNVNILLEMSVSPNQDEIDELIEGHPDALEMKQVKEDQAKELEVNVEESTQEEDEALVVAEAELKELEFRARALKSLVRARERQQQSSEGAE